MKVVHITYSYKNASASSTIYYDDNIKEYEIADDVFLKALKFARKTSGIQDDESLSLKDLDYNYNIEKAPLDKTL